LHGDEGLVALAVVRVAIVEEVAEVEVGGFLVDGDGDVVVVAAGIIGEQGAGNVDLILGHGRGGRSALHGGAWCCTGCSEVGRDGTLQSPNTVDGAGH
jgi:hypothetical protein